MNAARLQMERHFNFLAEFGLDTIIWCNLASQAPDFTLGDDLFCFF